MRDTAALDIEQLQTVIAGAQRLGITGKKFYDYAGQGLFPPGVVVRIGRNLRVNMPKLEQWIEAGGSGFGGGWRKEAQ